MINKWPVCCMAALKKTAIASIMRATRSGHTSLHAISVLVGPNRFANGLGHCPQDDSSKSSSQRGGLSTTIVVQPIQPNTTPSLDQNSCRMWMIRWYHQCMVHRGQHSGGGWSERSSPRCRVHYRAWPPPLWITKIRPKPPLGARPKPPSIEREGLVHPNNG